MSIITVATIIPAPEHRAAVIAAFEAAIPEVQAEDGCELYALHESEDQLVMIEKWASPEALKAHGTSPALQKLGAAVADKLAGPLDVRNYTPHPAGTAELGTL